MNLLFVFTNFVRTPMFINDALICISVDVTDAWNDKDKKLKNKFYYILNKPRYRAVLTVLRLNSPWQSGDLSLRQWSFWVSEKICDETL